MPKTLQIPVSDELHEMLKVRASEKLLTLAAYCRTSLFAAATGEEAVIGTSTLAKKSSRRSQTPEEVAANVRAREKTKADIAEENRVKALAAAERKRRDGPSCLFEIDSIRSKPSFITQGNKEDMVAALEELGWGHYEILYFTQTTESGNMPAEGEMYICHGNKMGMVEYMPKHIKEGISAQRKGLPLPVNCRGKGQPPEPKRTTEQMEAARLLYEAQNDIKNKPQPAEPPLTEEDLEYLAAGRAAGLID